MNDTTFNAAANSTIKFDLYDNADKGCVATTYENQPAKHPGCPAHFTIWKFDVVEHYRSLLRDEFGILSLESRLEELNVQEDDNMHMHIFTPALLEVIGAAIEQELELEGGLLLFAREGELCLFCLKSDADKLARLDDEKDAILARADYLGVLDLVQIWTSKKNAA